MSKILYINQHTIQRIEERSKIDILYVLEKYNQTGIKKFKVLQTINTKEGLKHYIKEALYINNQFILPMNVFVEDNTEHYKILSLLFENQFFSSISLNFGLHTDYEIVKFDEIKIEDKYFPKEMMKNYEEQKEWNFRITEEEPDRVFEVSNRGNNYITEKYGLPISIETFNRKCIKLI